MWLPCQACEILHGHADAHLGYGFPIGGVAASARRSVIVRGGVGFDIKLGVRLLRSDLRAEPGSALSPPWEPS